MNPVRLPVVDPAGVGHVHHTVTAIENRTCVRVFTTTWRDPKPNVGMSSPQRGAIQNLRWRVLTTTSWPSKTRVGVSSPQRGGTPKPRVRLHGPVGRGAVPWGGDDSAIETPTGLNKMRSPHATRPDSSAGWNGGRACGDVDGWGHVGLVAPRRGAFSTPHASPGFGPAPCGVGAEPWALGCHHVVVKTAAVLNGYHVVVKSATRRGVNLSLLIRSFFDGWRHPVCDSSYSGSLRINAWAERRLHNAARRNQRWAIRRRLIWTVAGSR